MPIRPQFCGLSEHNFHFTICNRYKNADSQSGNDLFRSLSTSAFQLSSILSYPGNQKSTTYRFPIFAQNVRIRSLLDGYNAFPLLTARKPCTKDLFAQRNPVQRGPHYHTFKITQRIHPSKDYTRNAYQKHLLYPALSQSVDNILVQYPLALFPIRHVV